MSAATRFEATLEHLRQDAWSGIQLLYLDLAFNDALRRDEKALRVVNETALLWNSTRHGWQCGYMIALGRAYDHTTQHNVTALLKIFADNLGIFSKPALSERKRAMSSNADEWLPGYLKDVHVPTAEDVNRLQSRARTYQELYNTKYRPLRSKVFAHRVLGNRDDVVRLYSVTRIAELQKLFVYLLKLHDALRELYINGRRPILRPMKYSLSGFMKEADKWPTTGRVHESIVAEVKELLELLRVGAAQQSAPSDRVTASRRRGR